MPGRPYFLLREPDEVHPLPASEGQEQQRRLLVITSLPQGGVFLELIYPALEVALPDIFLGSEAPRVFFEDRPFFFILFFYF